MILTTEGIVMNIVMVTEDEGFNRKAECGYRYLDSEQESVQPHTHAFYEIFLITSGTAKHCVNGVNQTLREGTLMFIRAEDVHYFIKTTQPYRWINVNFSKNTLSALLNYISIPDFSQTMLSPELPPYVELSGNQKQRCVKNLSKLNYVNWKNDNDLKLETRRQLFDLFVTYFLKKEEEYNKYPEWFEHLCYQMKKFENFSVGAERMYELCPKSKSHLIKCMKKYLNTTVSEFINKQRLSYAANMLINSSLPIIDIILDSGFDNLNYFYKLFKKENNMSPKKFRNTYSHI